MNYYEELGINRNASDEDIKALYRKLVKVYHPDVGGNPEKLKRIIIAYETLGDLEKRKGYDYYLSNQQEGHPGQQQSDSSEETSDQYSNPSQRNSNHGCIFKRKEPELDGITRWTKSHERLWENFCDWMEQSAFRNNIDFQSDPLSSFFPDLDNPLTQKLTWLLYSKKEEHSLNSHQFSFVEEAVTEMTERGLNVALVMEKMHQENKHRTVSEFDGIVSKIIGTLKPMEIKKQILPSIINHPFREVEDIMVDFQVELEKYCFENCKIKDSIFNGGFSSVLTYAFDFGYLKGLDLIYEENPKRKSELISSINLIRKSERNKGLIKKGAFGFSIAVPILLFIYALSNF
ncbi:MULTISPECIES: J domain-containing protein [Bacillaceae]|uniref:DnaJ domain-containing protein n=1 Tax=Evansella alkalicola TaxID=745819 RepID=A0ABS6JX47_9BACI|nr:DnaJ domain-containing protein [Litchfieldia alkalitelluris]MBU9723159.1 DnaJ domain-containing protein [Bacillus alkalicola]